MLTIFNTIYNDAPQPWQIGFQDSAAPGFTGIVELHNTIFFYLVVICVGVFWVLGSIIYYFNSHNSPIVHKYLNHGKSVPIQKCFKFKLMNYNKNYIRFYSTTPSSKVNSIKFYEDAYSMRKLIIKDNQNKSGIYKWTNKLTNDIYIGQSLDLSKRFIRYFNLSYLKNRDTLVISRALIKYGYSNFSLEILEYCDIANLTEREQYYFDKLNPEYNTLKIAGSSLGRKLTEETKTKISKSLKKSKINKKTHTEETKDLMRQKALGRKHSEDTLLKMSASRGYLVNIQEKCDSEGFKLIGSFVSIRRAAKFLGISSNTIRLYINSGKIFKDRYKFTGNVHK